MSIDIAPTLGWDTVFAVHIDDLNKVIAARKASPAAFSMTDPDDAISVTGKFGTWQIVPGGSGGLLWMKVPFYDTVLTMNGKVEPPMSGAVTIEFRLRFMDQDAGDARSPRTRKLTVQSGLGPSGEPAVSRQNLDIDGGAPGFQAKIALDTLLDLWMNAHLEEFQHVFAAVDVNEAAAHDRFQWLQPTHVDYAYNNLGPKDGLLAVLCMTERRPPTDLAQQVVAAAIPAGQRAGLLIAKRRLLEKLVLPMMPQIFEGSRATDFAVSASGESIATATKNVDFTVKASDGSTFKAQLLDLQLSLMAETLTLTMVSKTEISPGINALCRVENFLGVRLVNVGGKQTLAFYDIKPQALTRWTEHDPKLDLAAEILGLIALFALAVAAFATAGTALAVGALVIGLLAGAAAAGILLTKSVIELIGTAKAPTIDALLMNSTNPISWTGAESFRLASAQLNDSMQLGGVLSFES